MSSLSPEEDRLSAGDDGVAFGGEKKRAGEGSAVGAKYRGNGEFLKRFP